MLNKIGIKYLIEGAKYECLNLSSDHFSTYQLNDKWYDNMLEPGVRR